MIWRLDEGEWIGTGDQTGAAFSGDVVPAPLEQDYEFAVEFNEVGNVDEDPGESGQEAGESKSAKVGNRGVATDYGQVAFVQIFERLNASGY